MIFKEINDGYLDENRIIWQKEQCKGKFTFDEAIEYCKSLGGGWRMPNIKEMMSIIDYGRRNPASDLPDMMKYNYWSDTIYVNNRDYAWIVYYDYGVVNIGNKQNTYHVRAVKDFNSKAVEKKDGMVNHPKHYQKVPDIECIDVVEHFNFNIGNLIKYVWRCDEKENPIEDLEKARWYLEREIRKRET